ncbi:hypothetical protein V8G54_011322 [Vigna mungo]|uniref:Uncharacterized protein n=1 Tax=Vigna mungo TaxID=3915 RepID=A0AAQ3S2T4_VIGMU
MHNVSLFKCTIDMLGCLLVLSMLVNCPVEFIGMVICFPGSLCCSTFLSSSSCRLANFLSSPFYLTKLSSFTYYWANFLKCPYARHLITKSNTTQLSIFLTSCS